MALLAHLWAWLFPAAPVPQPAKPQAPEEIAASIVADLLPAMNEAARHGIPVEAIRNQIYSLHRERWRRLYGWDVTREATALIDDLGLDSQIGRDRIPRLVLAPMTPSRGNPPQSRKS